MLEQLKIAKHKKSNSNLECPGAARLVCAHFGGRVTGRGERLSEHQ
jgi:hypothetical protein